MYMVESRRPLRVTSVRTGRRLKVVRDVLGQPCVWMWNEDATERRLVPLSFRRAPTTRPGGSSLGSVGGALCTLLEAGVLLAGCAWLATVIPPLHI